MVRSFRYKQKRIGDFCKAFGIAEMIGSDLDSVFIDKTAPGCGISSSYLMDTGIAPYILSVSNARFIPSSLLNRPTEPTRGDRPRLPDGVRKVAQKKTNLITTGDGQIFSESFCRNGAQGVPSYDFIFDGEHWLVDHSDQLAHYKGLYLYLGIWSTHFGHFLVDSLCHLWPLLNYSQELTGIFDGFVVFSGHCLDRDSSKWPGFINEILECTPVVRDKIVVLNDPSSFEKCLIPRKISPRCEGGKLYNHTMQSISRNLSLKKTRRIYLSRSRLDTAADRVDHHIESLIELLFIQRGFKIIHPELLPLSEQARIISSADLIAGCVGSHLHLTAFSRNSNLKLFRICPSFFAPDIDAFILFGIGEKAEVTDYRVNCPAPSRQRHKKPFLEKLDITDLSAEVDKWLRQSN